MSEQYGQISLMFGLDDRYYRGFLELLEQNLVLVISCSEIAEANQHYCAFI